MTAHGLPAGGGGERDADRGEPMIPPRQDPGRRRDHTPDESARFARAFIIGCVLGWAVVSITYLLVAWVLP